MKHVRDTFPETYEPAPRLLPPCTSTSLKTFDVVAFFTDLASCSSELVAELMVHLHVGTSTLAYMFVTSRPHPVCLFG